MPKPLPYYPMYVYDFDEDPNVLAMNLSEVGLYQLALNEAWKRGSIPDDPTALANLIRRNPVDVKRAWLKVQACWVKSSVAGRLINPRLEKEREKANAVSESRSTAAKIRHLPPAFADANAPPNACANADANAEHLHTYESVSDSVSASRFKSSPEETTTSRARVAPETILRLWCDHRGFKKPARSQRGRIVERLAVIDLTEEEIRASMDGFYQSDWGRENSWPIFGWMKNPESWITSVPEGEEALGPMPEETIPSYMESAGCSQRFRHFIGLYAVSGKEIFLPQVKAVWAIWERMSEDQREGTISHAERTFPAKEADYIKSPENYLKSQPWTAIQMPRALPQAKPDKLDPNAEARRLLREEAKRNGGFIRL